MELTYEKVKSIILTVLVVMSVILTMEFVVLFSQMWRNLEIESMVKEVLLSEKKDIKEIVRIEQIIFNLEGNYYGTLSTEKIDNLMNAISSWEFQFI